MNGWAGLAAWRPRIAIAALVVVVGSAAVFAAGPESPAITRMLGSGVHAYFSGDFLRSYEDLSAAVEAGSEDPRVLYFRGLSALRLGRFDEAEADFSRGADLEAAPSANWPVPRSLERVQGCDRIRLERHRARARVARLQLDRDQDEESNSWIGSQSEVLREKRPAPGGDSGNMFDPRREPAVEPPRTPAPEALPTPPAEDERDVPEERDGGEESGTGAATDREVMPPADAGGADAGGNADAAAGGGAEAEADAAGAGDTTPEGGVSDEGGNTGAGTDPPAAGGGMDGGAGTDAAGEGGMDGEAGGVTDGAAGDAAGDAANSAEGTQDEGDASPNEGQ